MSSAPTTNATTSPTTGTTMAWYRMSAPQRPPGVGGAPRSRTAGAAAGVAGGGATSLSGISLRPCRGGGRPGRDARPWVLADLLLTLSRQVVLFQRVTPVLSE